MASPSARSSLRWALRRAGHPPFKLPDVDFVGRHCGPEVDLQPGHRARLIPSLRADVSGNLHGSTDGRVMSDELDEHAAAGLPLSSVDE